jgi:kinesin family protein 6/9
MKKNPVKVCLRTRPTATFAQDQIMIDQDKNTITINNGHVHADGGPSNKKDSWQFKYHQVLHNASQETVYETITRDVVQGFFASSAAAHLPVFTSPPRPLSARRPAF